MLCRSKRFTVIFKFRRKRFFLIFDVLVYNRFVVEIDTA